MKALVVIRHVSQHSINKAATLTLEKLKTVFQSDQLCRGFASLDGVAALGTVLHTEKASNKPGTTKIRNTRRHSMKRNTPATKRGASPTPNSGSIICWMPILRPRRPAGDAAKVPAILTGV